MVLALFFTHTHLFFDIRLFFLREEEEETIDDFYLVRR